MKSVHKLLRRKTDEDGWKVPLAVGGDKPKGAEGYVVARNYAYADKLGVKDPGTYLVYALFDDGAGFAPVSLAEATVTVKRTSISGAKVTGIKDKTYTGKELTQSGIRVVLNGKTLVKGTDYKVTYKNNTNAGTATVTIKGQGNYTGTVKESFKIKAVVISSAKLSYTSKVYTGNELKPTATVKAKVNGKTKTLKAGTDYSISYKNNKNVGTATVTIKGKGNYSGTQTPTFQITKATQTVQTVTPKSGATKTIAQGKSFTIKATASKEQGTAQFKKVSGNSKLTITSAGKVTAKKGLVKGRTYILKYKVRIKATRNYNTTKYVTRTVKIKIK